MKIKLLLIHYFLKPHINNHDKIQSTFDTGAISVQIIFVRSLKSQIISGSPTSACFYKAQIGIFFQHSFFAEQEIQWTIFPRESVRIGAKINP